MNDNLPEDEVSPHIKAQIDRGLKMVFDKIVEEEIPQKFKDLLERLDEEKNGDLS